MPCDPRLKLRKSPATRIWSPFADFLAIADHQDLFGHSPERSPIIYYPWTQWGGRPGIVMALDVIIARSMVENIGAMRNPIDKTSRIRILIDFVNNIVEKNGLIGGSLPLKKFTP